MNKNILTAWLPLAVGGTIIFGVIYGAVQQDYRQSANDPQIQLAEDAAAALSGGLAVDNLFGNGLGKLDMSKSIYPFVIVYDETGKLVGSSATYGTTTVMLPAIPAGVFDYVRAHGEDRVTWQIPSGQRFAAVVTHYDYPGRPASNEMISVAPAPAAAGFVIAARSLREVEIRENKLTTMLFLGWVGFLVATYAIAAGASYLGQKGQAMRAI